MKGRPGPKPLISVVTWEPAGLRQSHRTRGWATKQLATEQKTVLLMDSACPTDTSKSNGFENGDRNAAPPAILLVSFGLHTRSHMPRHNYRIFSNLHKNLQLILTWKRCFRRENTAWFLGVSQKNSTSCQTAPHLHLYEGRGGSLVLSKTGAVYWGQWCRSSKQFPRFINASSDREPVPSAHLHRTSTAILVDSPSDSFIEI